MALLLLRRLLFRGTGILRFFRLFRRALFRARVLLLALYSVALLRRRRILRRTLPRIVRHIPSRSLELNRRRRNRLLHFSAAMRTLLQMRPRYRLNLLGLLPAFHALVLVQWQCSFLPNQSEFRSIPRALWSLRFRLSV